MATASGTDAYCGINPQYLLAHQRSGDYRARYSRHRSYYPNRSTPARVNRTKVPLSCSVPRKGWPIADECEGPDHKSFYQRALSRIRYPFHN